MSALRNFENKRYRLVAFVVMNDHIHVLMTTIEPFALQDVLHSWKSFTANRLQREQGRRGRIWQQEYFERTVRDEHELAQKFDYIRSNPWARWPEIESYRWVWPLDD